APPQRILRAAHKSPSCDAPRQSVSSACAARLLRAADEACRSNWLVAIYADGVERTAHSIPLRLLLLRSLLLGQTQLCDRSGPQVPGQSTTEALTARRYRRGCLLF